MRYASEHKWNIGDAGGNTAAAVADRGGSGDDLAPHRGAAGTDKSHSGSGKKLCTSGRSSADHGRVAALRRESDHSDITRERCASEGNGVGAGASGRPF